MISDVPWHTSTVWLLTVHVLTTRSSVSWVLCAPVVINAPYCVELHASTGLLMGPEHSEMSFTHKYKMYEWHVSLLLMEVTD